VVNAYCVNIILFYSVAKKKNADLPTKKAKAAGPSSKKAKAAGLSTKKAKAAGLPSRKPTASAEVITQQILKYVQNVACVNVINMPLSEILKKQAFQPKKTELLLRNRKDNPKKMRITIHWRKYKSFYVEKLLTLFSQRTAGHWFW
jgi:hypothetical protein